MQVLGPLSYEGTRRFFVDFSNQLGVSELITTITISLDGSDITVDDEGITTEDITTKDGSILTAYKTIYFRAISNVNITGLVSVNLAYTTDENNSDTSTVKIKIVPTIL